MREKIASSDPAAGVTLMEGGRRVEGVVGVTMRGRGGEMESVEMVSREGGDMMNRLEVVRLRVLVDVEG